MKKLIILLFILHLLFSAGCSYKYLNRPFGEFSASTEAIGKNTVYAFEQLQEEEINLRIIEAVEKDNLQPADLEPRVITARHLALRKKLIDYIVDYVKLLQAIVTADYSGDITKNAKKVYDNLQSINSTHGDFLSKNELGVMSTLTAGLPEMLAAARSRKFLIHFMKQNGPLLKKIAAVLAGELAATKEMIDNFYSRQFILTCAEPWPEAAAKRGKYAEAGANILARKRRIDAILDELAGAIPAIPETHEQLMGYVKKDKAPLRSLAALINFAARVEALYTTFSGDKDDGAKK